MQKHLPENHGDRKGRKKILKDLSQLVVPHITGAPLPEEGPKESSYYYQESLSEGQTAPLKGTGHKAEQANTQGAAVERSGRKHLGKIICLLL